MLVNLLVELIGTFLFVYIFLHINSNSSTIFKNPTLKVATICFALFAIMLIFGSISGGYFNPAVIVAKMFNKSIDITKGLLYILIQLFGGFLAYYLWENVNKIK